MESLCGSPQANPWRALPNLDADEDAQLSATTTKLRTAYSQTLVLGAGVTWPPSSPATQQSGIRLLTTVNMAACQAQEHLRGTTPISVPPLAPRSGSDRLLTRTLVWCPAIRRSLAGWSPTGARICGRSAAVTAFWTAAGPRTAARLSRCTHNQLKPAARFRIVFAEGPGRYVPGGFPMGSGEVGYVRSGSLNLHDPGAVRALLDAASASGWQPGERRAVEVDGWPLLEAAATARAGDADSASP
jgi:hypothetical protein